MSVIFMAASGSEISLQDAGIEAKNYIWPLTTVTGGNSGPCRLGFFGSDGHGDSILVSSYNSSTYVVGSDGEMFANGSGVLVPMRYVDSGTVWVSGINGGIGWDWDLNQSHRVPCESGTLLIRFFEPTLQSVTTSNVNFRSVALDADDAVADYTAGAVATDVHIYAFETSRHGFLAPLYSMDGDGDSGYDGDTAWERIDAGAADNKLDLWDHAWSAPIHDWSVVVSVSPQKTGAITAFGFMIRIDYV
jgi:hypothetical protein